jgi:all-trans-retinol 13,14-reductase
MSTHQIQSPNPQSMPQFDVIVIGSGIGGLTTAALLAKSDHKSVLVLEQHFVAGGLTQTFQRQGFRWDIGLECVGGMMPGQVERKIFDYITNGKLEWQKMPELFQKIVLPDLTFEIYATPQRYQTDLRDRFPLETIAIRTYFRHIQQLKYWYVGHLLVRQLPHSLRQIFAPLLKLGPGKLAHLSLQAYLDQHFCDPQLKAILAATWGPYGLPPTQMSFAVQAMTTVHYLDGGWYPVGGSKAIADTIRPVIEQAGGKILTQQLVQQILIKHGRAIGVTVENRHHHEHQVETYYAPVIVSDAGAFNTYTQLIPPGYAQDYRRSLQQFPKSHSPLILFLGLNASPEILGFGGEHYWIFSDMDYDRAFADQLIDPSYRPRSAFLSFPSLKDPTAHRHTAILIVFGDYSNFQAWQGQPWRQRDPDYYQLKTQITQAFIDWLEGYYPGFRQLIAYQELSTPLTMAYFGQSDRGAAYGIPWVPDRIDQPWIGAQTPIKNLYLTGSDALSPGVVGAMMGGVQAAGRIQGFGRWQRMMANIIRPPRSSQPIV